jgi:hypothetical protein
MIRASIWTTAMGAAWIIIALATLATMIGAAYVGAADAPVADEWRYVDPAIYLQDLFLKNNGHPLVIGRLGLALDYWLFDARGWSLRAASFAFAGTMVFAALVLTRIAGHRSLPGQIAIGSCAAIVLFNPQGAQNFYFGFQFTFVLAFAAAIGAISALAAYADRARPWRLALAFALSIVAVFSLGNGIMAPFLLALMAWRLGLNRRVWVGFAAAGVLSAIALAVAPSVGAPERIVLAPLDMAVFALRVLGGTPALTLGALTSADAMAWSLVFGIVELIGALALGFRLALNAQPNPGRLGGVALMLFAIGSAAAIALVRGGLNDELALSSRYALVSSTMLIGLVLTYWPLAPQPTLQARALTALAVIVLAATPFAGAAEIKTREAAQREIVRAESALVLGLIRAEAVGFYAPPDMMEAQTNVLRASGKWLFQDQWSRSIGRRIDVSAVQATCAGATRPPRAVADAPEFARMRGDVDARAGGRIVVIVDSAGLAVGYGLKPRRLGDLLPILDPPSHRADWLGVARSPASAGTNYSAYLATRTALLCRIGAPARASTG